MKKAAQGFSLLWWKRKGRGLLCDRLAGNKTATNSHFSFAVQPRKAINPVLHCSEQGRSSVLSSAQSSGAARLCWTCPAGLGWVWPACLPARTATLRNVLLFPSSWFREIAVFLLRHIKVYETNKQQHTQLFWGRWTVLDCRWSAAQRRSAGRAWPELEALKLQAQGDTGGTRAINPIPLVVNAPLGALGLTRRKKSQYPTWKDTVDNKFGPKQTDEDRARWRIFKHGPDYSEGWRRRNHQYHIAVKGSECSWLRYSHLSPEWNHSEMREWKQENSWEKGR